jgi:predicted nucleotidyltransferase
VFRWLARARRANGQIKLDQKPPGIGTSFVTEVIKDENGDLANKVVQVVPNVNQTLGFSKESSTGSARLISVI